MMVHPEQPLLCFLSYSFNLYFFRCFLLLLLLLFIILWQSSHLTHKFEQGLNFERLEETRCNLILNFPLTLTQKCALKTHEGVGGNGGGLVRVNSRSRYSHHWSRKWLSVCSRRVARRSPFSSVPLSACARALGCDLHRDRLIVCTRRAVRRRTLFCRVGCYPRLFE
ncbi:hypothetical protein FOCC_FOCC003549, partial [Frankliniella occidentalis]